MSKCDICGETDSDFELCDECGRLVCDANCLQALEEGDMNEEPVTVCVECYRKWFS